MPIYVMLANFGEAGKQNGNDSSKCETVVYKQITDLRAKLIASYCDFKHYDIVNVIVLKSEKHISPIIHSLIDNRLVRTLEVMGPYEYGRQTDNFWLFPDQEDPADMDQTIQGVNPANSINDAEDTNELSTACPAGIGIT